MQSVRLGALVLGDLDVSKGDLHRVSRVELETEGALLDGRLGGIGNAFDSIEPSFVSASSNLNFEGIPALGFHGRDGFFAFGWVALFWDVGSGGEVTLQGAGHPDLNLIVVPLEHDPGIDFSFPVFVIEREGEVGKMLLSPKDRSLVARVVFGVDCSLFHRPMRDAGLGFNEPTFEVFSIEERLGV